MGNNEIKTVILRFRDNFNPDHPAIEAHSQILHNERTVWWGWFKRPEEEIPLELLRTISGKAPIVIGLYDRNENRGYSAKCMEIRIGSVNAEAISSPNQNLTPTYYAKAELSAWFKLSEINLVETRDFEEQFGGVANCDATIVAVKNICLTDKLDQTTVCRPTPEIGTYIDKEPITTNGEWILHISDTHYGKDHGFGTEQFSTTLAEYIETRLEFKKIGVLVISGDIVSRGGGKDGVDFNVAKTAIEQLCDKLKIQKSQVVMVPGNHDLTRDDYNYYDKDFSDLPLEEFHRFCDDIYKSYSRLPKKEYSIKWLNRVLENKELFKKSEKYFEGDYLTTLTLTEKHKILTNASQRHQKESLKGLNRAILDKRFLKISRERRDAEAHYRKFVDTFYEIKTSESNSFRQFRLVNGWLVRFACLNSYRHNGVGTPENGYLGGHIFYKDYIALLNKDGLTQDKLLEREEMNFVVMHHHIKPVANYALSDRYGFILDAFDAEKYFAKAGTHFVMHGHQHTCFTSLCGIYDFEKKKILPMGILGAGTAGSKDLPDGVGNIIRLYKPFSKGLECEIHKYVPNNLEFDMPPEKFKFQPQFHSNPSID
ncbi:MAG: metallophosphoesterase [bacterium]|nr:metallophosphoesterase [bacterium]